MSAAISRKLETHISNIYGRAVQLTQTLQAVEAMVLAEAGDRIIIANLCGVAIDLALTVETSLEESELLKVAAGLALAAEKEAEGRA